MPVRLFPVVVFVKVLEAKRERLKRILKQNGLKISRVKTESLKLRFENEIKENGIDHNVRLEGHFILIY